MRERKRRLGFMTLIGAMVLLAGCGQATVLPTPSPGESSGGPADGAAGTPTTAAPTESVASPTAPGAAAPTSAVIVGTSIAPSGSIISPPLRDITPAGPPTPGPVMTPDTSGTVIVGMDDAGRSVELRVGDTLQLALPSIYDWTVSITDTAILTAVGTSGGGQGKYNAVQAGTTTLLADGEPACRKTTPPCEMPSRLVRIAIIVR